jgi:hypothetical protein
MTRPHPASRSRRCSAPTVRKWARSGFDCAQRQHGHSVPTALAVTHRYFAALKDDVLYAQAVAFHETQTAAVEQQRHDPRHAGQLAEQGLDLGARQHDRNAVRALSAHEIVEPTDLEVQHLAVQEQQRSQCLVLRRRTDGALDCQHGEKGAHLGRTELGWMTLVMKMDVSADPSDVRLLGAITVVIHANGVADLIEQSARLRRRRGRRRNRLAAQVRHEAATARICRVHRAPFETRRESGGIDLGLIAINGSRATSAARALRLPV